MANFYASYPLAGGGGGSGDVVGPASSDNNGLVLFDGTTGKSIKEATGTGIVSIVSGVATILANPLPIANGGTNSSTALNNNRVIISSGSAIVEASAITASRAVVSDVSGIPVAATTTATEIGYVNGVTSSIQTQLNSKQATLTPGSISTTTTGVTVGSGASSTVGPNVTVDVQTASGSQPGLLSSADWSTFNGKQASGSYITALTGDVAASGPGSATATLATVNSNTGSFGSSTAIPSFTVNGKGLMTAASTNAVIAPAGTLTGTTLAANVVSSSLTSVGTITSGTWTGTTIALANGGTGQTTQAAAFNALSPMTTKGDMIAYSTTGVRVAVGTDGQAMIADAASTPGVKWGTPTPMLPSSMSDAVATALGYKTYLGDGTTYNGGVAPSITTNRASTSLKGSSLIPYQTQDGSWRLKIDLVVEYTANTSVIITINATTFKNATNYYQALAYTGFAGGAEQAYCNPGGSTISADATISTGRAAVNGDVELDSKPSWAY